LFSDGQINRFANSYYARLVSKGLADGSSCENQWEYTSIPWDIILPDDTLTKILF
jgi:hypothetical protein